METPAKISFVDDILLFMNSITRNSESVSQLGWILVHTFPAIFEKNHGMFNNLFTTINLVIVHGRSVISAEPKIIEMVL